MNLSKETKEMYSKNYKMLMKETEDDTNRWKAVSCSWIGRIYIVKITILTKAIYRFNTISAKISMAFFTVVAHQVMSHSLWPHGLQHTRPPCPSPSPGVCPSSCPLIGDAIKPFFIEVEQIVKKLL